MPAPDGEIVGQVAVAERLGGETYLYIRVAGQPLVVAQAAGNDSTRVHERSRSASNPRPAISSTPRAAPCRI